MTTLPKPPARLAWAMWGLGATLFLIGFFHRVAPAVMTTELMNAFGLSAAALGNLSAFYFYSYVAMQIPTGILVLAALLKAGRDWRLDPDEHAFKSGFSHQTQQLRIVCQIDRSFCEKPDR